ncbi:MAG: hypothetical protein KC646_01820 [Candidatus Cloacimonetes bacterium]|nr:hypothetical protein [Candidatus Cloacimonadota bacterium]
MKFLLKTEASVSIGFGHLKRLEVIAKELAYKGYEVLFVHFHSQKAMLLLDFTALHIDSEKEFLKLCKSADVLIIDEPEFPKSFYSAVDEITTIAIDELSDLRYLVDVHICSTLLGLDHQVLNLNQRVEYIGVKYFVFGRGIKKQVKNNKVLLSFGGSDPNEITEQFLKKCSMDNLDIVIGPGFTQKRRHFLKEAFPKLTFLENVKQLSLFMGAYKVIICSGGITAYEALKSGCIPLMIAQNQEQETTALNLVHHKLGQYFGLHHNFDETQLIKAINEVFEIEDVDSIVKHFQKLNGEDSTKLVVDLIIQHGQSGKI